MSNKYSNNSIYIIKCLEQTITDAYVGHTTNFYRRKIEHKTKCNNIKCKSYNINVYQFIRSHGGWNNWQIKLIKNYNCKDKLEAGERENFHLKELKATLNTRVPSRSPTEYYIRNAYSNAYNKWKSISKIFRNILLI